MSGDVQARPDRAPPVRAVTAALLGGALVCAGAALPWMSFFAGLQPLSGLIGLYGRLLFASGAIAIIAGTVMRRPRQGWLPPAVGVLGITQLLFVGWLLRGLLTTTRGLGMHGGHAMLLARPGPGLFIALAGAMLVATAMSPIRRGLLHLGSRMPNRGR